MLCRACHVHVRRDFPYCLHCGTLRRGVRLADQPPPHLRRLDTDGPPVPLTAAVTALGRDGGNDIVLDDPSVSRQHARVIRTPAGYTIEDLDSMNGTTVADRVLHGASAVLGDVTDLYIGDVPLRFEQPRPAAVGSKTVLRAAERTMLAPATSAAQPATSAIQPTATEPLAARPRQRSGWALKQLPDERGEGRWVLRNTRGGAYLELDERDVFLWHLLDGDNSIRDLLFAYAQRYGELALPRIERTLHAFAAADLVRGLRAGAPEAARPSFARRAGRALLTALLRLEVSVKGVDTVAGAAYRAFGWRLFTRTSVALVWLLIIGGLYAFWRALEHERLFDVGGAGTWGAVAVGSGYLLALVAHEGMHALAVKSYGRTVTRGGFMIMMGMPFAFVDTSDMWLGSRWSRIVVTLSGPVSTAALAGVVSIGAAFAPSPVVAGVCFQLAFGLYLNTLFNLNPIMPLDGYQALADALRLPRLREEAMAYATKGWWRDLGARRWPGVKQLGLFVYGLAAVICTLLFAVLGMVAWNSRLGGLVHDHLRPPWDSVIIVAGVALLMFPVWSRWAKRLIATVRRRRPRADAQAPSTEPVEVAA